ncbi:phage holin family protein [Candidatus Peribacteria bacterium]|nr:phage holin family protein [Candidatus Peribacteria bacterium]
MRFLWSILLLLVANAGVLWACSTVLFPELFAVVPATLQGYLITAGIFIILHYTLYPLLRVVFGALSLFLLGLTSFLVHGVMLWVQAVGMSYFSLGAALEVQAWWLYLVVGVLLALVNMVVHWFTD